MDRTDPISAQNNAEKPNIILILADQMTPFLTGAYGHSVVKTPNLDHLVEDGIRFDSAYTSSPLCAPARASMITGRYASNIECYDNGAPLSSIEPCIPHYLSSKGYETVASGKLHFIGPDQLHGFDKRLTTDIYPSDFSWTPDYIDRKLPMFKDKPHASGYAFPNVGVRKWSINLAYDTESTFRAIEFLRARSINGDQDKNKSDQKPFFLCVSYSSPHGPFHVTEDLWGLYDGAEIEIPRIPENVEKSYSVIDKWLYIFHGLDRIQNFRDPNSLAMMRRSYYCLVSHIDRQVGEILKAVEETELLRKTIIIFSSDHGDMLGEKGLIQKKMFYEWSARIPLIIKFPNHWGRGTKCNEPVSLIDLAPTILDIVGVDKRSAMDGESLLSLIAGANTENREVFSEIHAEGVYASCFMIRQGSYKYIYTHRHDSQLFDLENDPGEWDNLVGIERFRDVEEGLRHKILTMFDPDVIEKRTRESILKRQFIREVMKNSDVSWDYTPNFDGSNLYVRRKTGPKLN